MSFQARYDDLWKNLASWIRQVRTRIPWLPGINGEDRLEKGKENSAEKTIPVGLLPRWKEMEIRTLALPSKARDILSPKPLSGGSTLFTERKKELDILEAAFNRWKEGPTQMIAIVGPDAVGRTSLLNRFQADVAGAAPVRTSTLDRRVETERQLVERILAAFDSTEACTSTDELIALLSRQERQILFVDDAHYLMLRTPQTLGVMEHFLSVLLATQNRFFWLMSFTEQSWRRLDQLYGLSRYFTDVVTVPYFDKDACLAALRLRLEATGLNLAYPEERPADANPGSNASDGTGEDPEKQRKESLADCLLTGLYNLSRGNMKAALYYWNCFTAYDPVKKVLQVQTKGEIDYSALKKLDLDHLFSLGELLVHGPLTVREHACIFQRGLAHTRQHLDYLYQQRIVEKSEIDSDRREATYAVDSVFHLPLVSVLESAHILY